MITGFRFEVGFIFFTRLLALFATLMLITNSMLIVAAEPVTFEFSTEEKTIGDIKPPFIDFSSEASPLVPAKEVIRRYRLLFNTTADPVIRVDALLRITALEQRFGSDQELSEADEIQMHRRALASFEQLMSSADPVYPVDMLLYQSARSQDALGQREKAIASLKRLVGQFPRSDFATESWFRLAEFAFSEGEYRAAEKAYQKVLSAGVGTRFHSKAGFMLGWSVFKQGRQDEALARFTQFLDLMYADNADFDQLEGINLQTVQDTLRIMSIVFSYSEHGDPIDQLFSSVGRKPYADRLYRNLSDFYLNQERYEDSVTVNRNFIERNPGNNAAPLFAVKIIDTYKAARFSQQVWDEKRLFVQNYGLRSGFLLEAGEERRGNITPSLKAYLNDLSHLDFVAAQSAKKADARNQLYLRAAEYYEEYADLDSGAEDAGEKLHLAAEGYFRAGKFEKAAQVYYRSAYLVAKHKDSHESGYSALVALDRLAANEQTGDSANESRQIKYALKFAESFPKDKRTPQVLSVAANDLLSGGNYLRAADVARRIVEIGSQDDNVLKAAWLVQGQAQFEMGEFGQSEKALLAALKLISKKDQQYVTVTEQIAAAIYKAAEIANKRGQWQQAVEDYLRIEKIAPDSPIRINARYDAAAELLNRKEWKRAIPVLVEFRQDFPEHVLTQSISEKLIVAYLNSEQDLYAADELERV
ncbi:MAG: tetratricopeptide repeat protein, partial [Pseudomonadales bacterium]|nr:tetratricopeptide repeat protein [Pseudomonadales bacterium]